ncbi:MAG: hypothetical protein AB7F86_14905 [Bdellovibrionales bacterium]
MSFSLDLGVAGLLSGLALRLIAKTDPSNSPSLALVLLGLSMILILRTYVSAR